MSEPTDQSTAPEPTTQQGAESAAQPVQAGAAGGADPAKGRAAPATAGAGTATWEGAASLRLNAVLRHAERSALYHKAREGFFDSFHRFIMFSVLVTSSGAVYAMTQESQVAAPLLALIVAVLGALDMAIGFAQSARDHALLAREFLDLAADTRERDAIARVEDLEGRFYRLCGEEPPTFKALDALCDNQMCDAVDDPRPRLHISFLHRRLRHLVRFSGTRFAVVDTRRA